MPEFFKQIISQLSLIWQKLSIQQRLITSLLVGFTILGLFSLLLWSSKNNSIDQGFKKLYGNLDLEQVAAITEKLEKAGYKYKLENEGKTILVDSKKVYEIRMALAREGLPSSKGIGYELFDKTNFGTTDFVQKINARRALEGELQRTIEGLDEVKTARVHIVIPEHSIFLEKQQQPKASVVIKMDPGKKLTKEQVKGIAHLISSSVEGLETQNISLVDVEGRLLTSPFSQDETALASSQNLELQQNVERAMEQKLNQMLENILGPQKAKVQLSVDLDFNRVEKTVEKYDPESKVIRSEERNDDNVKNAPDGDRANERSLTNYEIDKTIEHIITETGNVKRLTISVAVDGRYTVSKDGKSEYEPRTTEELANIEDIVKNALGYDVARGDQIIVANMRFDNEYLMTQQHEIQKQEKLQLWMLIAKYGMIIVIAVLIILLIRYLAKTLIEAMNPPLPKVEIGAEEEEITVEMPETYQRSNEILERVEMMTQQEPVNITTIIREWLKDGGSASTKSSGGRKQQSAASAKKTK